MARPTLTSSSDGKAARLIRWSCWGIGIPIFGVLVIAAVRFAISKQISNELIVTNGCSLPIEIAIDIGPFDDDSSKQERRILFERKVIQPQASIHLTDPSGGNEWVRVYQDGKHVISRQAVSSWGKRSLLIIKEDSTLSRTDESELYNWIVNNRRWIPVWSDRWLD